MKDNARRFSYTDPIQYQGALYPSTVFGVEDSRGNVKDTRVFSDRQGQYFALDSQGSPIPVILQQSLPEVEIRPQRKRKADAFGEYLTMSNDRTRVNNVPHRNYNSHLEDRTVKGALSNALWEQEHPNLSSWGYAASSLPFAVAASPIAIAAGDALAGTSLGQAATRGLGIIANAARNSTLLPWVDAAVTSGFGAKGMQDVGNGTFTPETVMEIAPLIHPTTSLIEKGAKEAWYSKWAQYPRYYAGKIYYGNDVELPTLYRKLNKLPTIENDKIVLTNPNSRFAYTDGTASPVITNMTTDVPVRSHGAGNWDLANVLAFPGKTLLGKNVISTRPSDTFTFGDNITISPSKVTFISGSEDAVKAARNMGMNAKVSEESKKILDAYNKAEESANSFAFKQNKTNDTGYSKGIQQLTRDNFRSPTLKDYKFMDWVFQPQYRSEIYPLRDLSKIKTFRDFQTLPEQIRIRFGDARMRNYLLNPDEWRNVLYDPATTAEYEFRTNKRIDLKRNIHK